MRWLPAQLAAWCAAFGIVVFALGVVPTELSFRQAVVPAQTQAPREEGAACVPAPPIILAATAPEDTCFPPPLITLDAPLRPPVPETPSFPVTALAPPRNTHEETELARAAGQDNQEARAADAAAKEHPANTLATFRHDQSQTIVKIALTVGVFTLVTLGVFLFRRSCSPPSGPASSVETAEQDMPPVAPPTQPLQENGLMRLHIAVRYLSTPKQEDVILTDVTPQRYTLVCADGASSILCNGGEISGGGRQAAEIAALTAITHLRDHLSPPMCLAGMLRVLHDCFEAVNGALERHNASDTTPGGTTLLIAMLSQAGDGRWYWLSGNVGNGVLSLLHTEPLLAELPIHTPLLSRQANGVTTITLPGNGPAGFRPALGIRPHTPGDMLVIGSDGLDHLDTVTKKCDRLSFLNFLWKQIEAERLSLEQGLTALHQGRTDAAWANALALDDTTIGILWA